LTLTFILGTCEYFLIAGMHKMNSTPPCSPSRKVVQMCA
jgi:hypothetical protein